MSSWRLTQQKRFKSPVEFQQDSNIKSFFSKTLKKPTYYYGDVEYFSVINFSNKHDKYDQCLLIFNKLIEKNAFIDIVQECKYKKLNNNSKICICINKFLIYSLQGDKNAVDDYDQALYDIISSIFNYSQIDYSFIKNVKGDHFNFASPTTQFFIQYTMKP